MKRKIYYIGNIWGYTFFCKKYKFGIQDVKRITFDGYGLKGLSGKHSLFVIQEGRLITKDVEQELNILGLDAPVIIEKDFNIDLYNYFPVKCGIEEYEPISRFELLDI